jgi:hypothetical protein
MAIIHNIYIYLLLFNTYLVRAAVAQYRPSVKAPVEAIRKLEYEMMHCEMNMGLKGPEKISRGGWGRSQRGTFDGDERGSDSGAVGGGLE